MLTKKEYVLVLVSLFGFFSLYYFLFIDKINFLNIVLLTLVSSSLVKSIYDFINQTGDQDIYGYSKKKNQRMRFETLLINVILFYVILSVTCSSIKNGEFTMNNFEPFQLECISYFSNYTPEVESPLK